MKDVRLWINRQIISTCVGLMNSIAGLKPAKVSVSFPRCPKPRSRLLVKWSGRKCFIFILLYQSVKQIKKKKGSIEKCLGILTKEWK